MVVVLWCVGEDDLVVFWDECVGDRFFFGLVGELVVEYFLVGVEDECW